MKFLDGLTEPSYALMRFFGGLFFVQHGTQKLLNFPSEFTYELNALTLAAGWIELILGVAIAVGLFTRISAFLCSGMCAVGYWLAHGLGSFFPINNGGELIALYCFLFLFIACRGSGPYSVDAMLFGQKASA
ncbi:MAG: DoxX family protein [Pseudomonadota bacterium]